MALKLVIALHNFFRDPEKQTLQDFHKEIKELTVADREDFCQYFRDAGVDIEPVEE